MPLDRRRFLAGTAALPLLAPGVGHADDHVVTELALELYESLERPQRRRLCLSADDPRRRRVDNDWFVVGDHIGDVLRPAQQELALRLFLDLHAPDFAAEVARQVAEDNHAPGVRGLSLAFFGKPGRGQGLGLVFAGRHTTRHWEERSDAPYGGPVFGGHASGTFFEDPTHPGNIWWYQGLAANRLYDSLDEPQRRVALSGRQHLDTPACLEGPREINGLRFADLDPDRLELARALVHQIVARPFRPDAAARALRAIDARGGVAALSLHFFHTEDYGGDGVLDNFELWGPGVQCAFRGQHHCHSWLRVDA